MMKFAGLGRAAIVTLIFSGLAFGSVARAEDPSEAQVKEAYTVLDALGATAPFDNILPQIASSLKTQLIQASPNLEKEINDIVDEQALVIAKRRGDLEHEAAVVYAKEFTLDELKQIAAFYSSDLGKKFLKYNPIAARELNKAAQIWASGVSRDLSVAVAKEMDSKIKAQQPAPAASDAAPAPKP
ncbi:DUF2059 domain-containing protein [Rhizobium sp. NRK18]|uniref:DUF2059 domain-containing protein n=1 Tax=Rhizobium sp. NRK18 TaxID=2964667 RepID=UPI0021C34378|nr:DUF2059 domain-containing protein [Rhizobium sp. NRK18]MCQ2003980.1 DUF2059 domain-containing protein [Rhizobium sp. NRK18]